nr:GPO family capsid scaffolding protein [uncultured Ottowia sp.]
MKKRYRVATSGPTIDGREIKPEWLKQAAANYDTNIYAARINVEHLRSLSPNGEFGAFGDVTGLEAETGKDGKVALYAEIEPNEKAIAANKAGQKVYTSIEIVENFAGTGEAYLVGLALTDSPASLGTERLNFTAQPADATYTAQPFTPMGQKANAFAVGMAHPVELKFTENGETGNETEAKGFFAELKDALLGAFAAQPQKTQTGLNEGLKETLTAFAATTAQKLQEMQTALDGQKQAHDTLAAQFTSLKTQLEKQPAQTYTRPPAGTVKPAASGLTDI